MSQHADPDAFDGHLREMCQRVRDGATTDEAVAWLYCDAPFGRGIEPGYAGRDFYFPKRLRSKRTQRHREAIALRERGWRYEAIAMQLHMGETTVGEVCRGAGLGCVWYAREWPEGRK